MLAERMSENQLPFRADNCEVNGLNMYYEIYGEGKPLVLIHGGGSTIQSTFGRIIPLLAKSRMLIAVEMQAHGRTCDRGTELSFEQDADDVAVLLQKLGIHKADFFGFSNGGTTCLQMAIRHPHMAGKLLLGSALAKRKGMPDWFWEFMDQASLENMPLLLKEAYLEVTGNTAGLQIMHDRDAKRMQDFEDISDDHLSGIKSPVLILSGDKDVILPEHSLFLHRMLPNSRLAILPGGHGDYIGEITTLEEGKSSQVIVISLLEQFLDSNE